MSKDDHFELDGDVVELLRDCKFRIKLQNGQTILAHLSGKMRKNSIRVLLGDKVAVEMSPYDFEQGRIVKRYNTIKPVQQQDGIKRK
ncbi:MAG: translation initiation factor IF-1 [Bacillales bacterium]|jgi:translation initiation factor IF-1|nr:translation initiation factor IF-1 [Bacillales bacterium]